jgi:phosphoserine phosphatase
MGFAVVLTSANGVERAAIEAARAACVDPGTPERLSDTSVEIICAQVHALPDIDGVDVNAVPLADRRKSVLIADMDSTIIPVECIDELADYAGAKAQVSEITERAMQGELDFEAALDARVALIKGLTLGDIEACYQERVSLNPGARVLVRTMAAHGALTGLVSGGFTLFTRRVAEKAGFLINHANVLEIEDERLTGTVARPIVTGETKRKKLHAFAAQKGVASAQVLAVGDGANDTLMVKDAGLGVAYRAKSVLQNAANARINHSDLTALLALQGYKASDYVRD